MHCDAAELFADHLTLSAVHLPRVNAPMKVMPYAEKLGWPEFR
jgi:hypothetical protein